MYRVVDRIQLTMSGLPSRSFREQQFTALGNSSPSKLILNYANTLASLSEIFAEAMTARVHLPGEALLRYEGSDTCHAMIFCLVRGLRCQAVSSC